jgi:glycosyltransferase involved in cell wall biosynthesis
LHVLLLSAGKVLKTPFGGEDIFTRLLGKWLAQMHHEVTLMGIEFAGIRVRHLTHDNLKDERIIKVITKKSKTKKFGLGYLSYSLRTVFWLSQVLKVILINIKDPINIIHAQDSGYTGLAAIIAGKILDIPVIVSLLGIRYEQIESNPYINETLKRLALKIEYKLDVFTLSNANAVTIVSPTMKYYVEKVAPKSIIVSIPIAIKIKNFEFSELKRELLRTELKIDKKSIIIGFVGRLSHEKNLHTLLNSFAEAVMNDSSLKLVLVGKGPLEFELKRQALDMHVEDKVIFCGFRDDINNLLSSFDIFVLPSFIEGTSNALIEAMACGRAIICSDISANREIVTNDKEALMINPNDRDGLKEAILSLSSDEKLRSRLGHNAKINAEQYDEDIIFPKFLQYYQDLSKKLQGQKNF